jgi:hypothetical protein
MLPELEVAIPAKQLGMDQENKQCRSNRLYWLPEPPLGLAPFTQTVSHDAAMTSF